MSNLVFMILWVMMGTMILILTIVIPYMTYQNYKRIGAMNRNLRGLMKGLNIMFSEERGNEM